MSRHRGTARRGGAPSRRIGPVALFALLALLPGRAAAQQGTPSPHGETRVAIDCGRCHTSSGWSPARTPMVFDHARETGFRLTGEHRRIDCLACHTDARFDRPRAALEECATCHVDPHEGTLSIDCAQCHETLSFREARAPELHRRTSFPLIGAHAAVECERCHRDGLATAVEPLAVECVSCHATDYVRVRFPDHQALSFPDDCAECHPPTAWGAGRFDHAAQAGFPLVGAHLRAACTSCHTPPGYDVPFAAAGPDDCVACHSADADRAHPGAFQPTCVDCHSVETWRGATFDHDGFFPIFSGEHRGKWDACQDCHTTGVYSTFTCSRCHARGEMDDKHSDEPGYAYDPILCLSCHPRGDKEED